MSGNVLAAAARQSLQVLRWQLGWIAALALACAAALGAQAGWSVLVGGGIGLIWTIYMAATLYGHSRDHGVRMSAFGFVMGWLIKVALTIALLIVALRSSELTPLAVLGGLFSALTAYWAWLTFQAKKRCG